MPATFRTWFALAAVAVCGLPGAASADVTLTFSDYTNPPGADPVPTATATFAVTGAELAITVSNTSASALTVLYFNTDEMLTGLTPLAPAPQPDPYASWFPEGSGASQDWEATPFGRFNWYVNFGDDFIPAGETRTFLALMTGTTTEETIGSKLSDVSESSATPVLAAAEFLGGDSFVLGATVSATTGGGDPNPVPAPAGLPLFAAGLLGVAWLRRRG